MKKYVPKSFWRNYWETKKILKPVNKHHFFKSLFDNHIKNQGFKNLIEIGGFPGHYAVYFKKYYNLQPTILDYYIDQPQLNTLFKINNLKPNDIKIIKADFLTFKSSKKYDVVASFGFLEHFDDTKTIIQSHRVLAKPGGKIIIAIPNFLGLNGYIQKIFDPTNLSAHNLKSMDIQLLTKIMDSLNLVNYKIAYYGGLLIWLENIKQRNIILRALFLIINLTGYLLKSLGFNSKWTSPYIVIIATK